MRAEVPIVRTRRRMNLGERRDAGVKRLSRIHRRLAQAPLQLFRSQSQWTSWDLRYAVRLLDIEKLLSRGVELAGYCLRLRALNR
jgi:hypothetical protein